VTEGSTAGAAEAIRAGRYAHAEVDLSALAGGAPIELSLAAPFGALISALLLERPYRVSRLALDYVAYDRLSSRATFSVKVSEIRQDREATLSLLVYRGSRLLVRGEANVLVNAGAPREVGHSSNGKSTVHMNGESR
jgi:hypothetical protein